jgi:purine-binding chemotaxis protein CheW
MFSSRWPGSHSRFMMTEKPITSEIHGLVNENGAEDLRDLLPFTIGGRTFAVFTDQVDGTAENKPFAALPRAPAAVVGVVCVRGRMLTVLDPAAVLDSQAPQWEQSLPSVIVLRGDEQLGLVAETCRDTITISAADIEQSSDGEQSQDGFLMGLVRYAGEEMLILDSARLFSRAVRRRERRRRRI